MLEGLSQNCNNRENKCNVYFLTSYIFKAKCKLFLLSGDKIDPVEAGFGPRWPVSLVQNITEGILVLSCHYSFRLVNFIL